jgi:methionyl aminopeptidase
MHKQPFTNNVNRLIRTAEEIGLIEKACRIVADTLSLIEKYIAPGIETIELDKIAEDYIKSLNAYPAFKGYKVDDKYYPNTLCISIDEEVVHGIPGNRKLKEGEIVSVDCGAKLNGYYGDSAYTFPVGEITEEKKRLLQVTQESLMLGIEQAVDRNKVYDISRAVQDYCESKGYSLTRELFGHGIGSKLHEEPSIPNFVPPLLHRGNFPNMKLYTGMALAIEPMVHAGAHQVKTLKDGWTVVTSDNSPAAHFEHTVIVQDGKPLILTIR